MQAKILRKKSKTEIIAKMLATSTKNKARSPSSSATTSKKQADA